MDRLRQLVDFFVHLDHHLHEFIVQYGEWAYLLLFVVILCETGLVVTPLLPGDSLLFVAGAFAASGSLRIEILIPLLAAAAILGDSANYGIGALLRHRLADRGKLPFIKQ